MRATATASILFCALWAGPAAAFDCAKAATPTEKMICAQPALKALDDAMSAAYGALSARIAADAKPALLVSQRNFIAGLYLQIVREPLADDDFVIAQIRRCPRHTSGGDHRVRRGVGVGTNQRSEVG